MRLPPAPRETAQKWLAFGAVVVVIVGASFASSAFKSHLAKTLPQPDPPSFTPSVPVASPSGEDDPDDAPPADDEAPKFASTIEASMNARPPWSPAGAYAPQHSTPLDLLGIAKTLDAPLFRGFAICRVDLDDAAPVNPGDELEVRMNVGATPEIFVRSSRQEGIIVSAPLATLGKTEKLVVRVSVRSGAKVTPISRLADDLADREISFATDGKVILLCETVAQDDLDARVAKDAGRADVLLRRLALPKLDPSKVDWGYPKDDLARAHTATTDVAALVGWDDPRTRRRVSALVGVQASFDAASEPVFDHFHRSAMNTALAGGLDVNLESFSCAKHCIAKLSLKNPGDRSVPWSGEKGLLTYVATRHGGPTFFDRDAKDPAEVPPYATVSTVLNLPEGLAANEPAILGICTASQCSVLRLR